MKNLDERYLPLLAEECAEVVQAVTKAQRFGVHDSHPDYHSGAPNVDVIVKELGDVLAVAERAGICLEDLRPHIYAKHEKLNIYGPDGSYLAAKAASQ